MTKRLGIPKSLFLLPAYVGLKGCVWHNFLFLLFICKAYSNFSDVFPEKLSGKWYIFRMCAIFKKNFSGGSELFFLINSLWFSREGTVPPLALVGPWKARVSCCQDRVIKYLLGTCIFQKQQRRGVWVSGTRLLPFHPRSILWRLGWLLPLIFAPLHTCFLLTSLPKFAFSSGDVSVA